MISADLMSQESAAKTGATLSTLILKNDAYAFRPAEPDDFGVPNKVAIFVHGFTANATYMGSLMKQFADNGYIPLAFNYPCYDGIDTSARRLQDFLVEFDQLSGSCISNNRIVVIGHSMGGLVARALVGLEGGHKYVRQVFTLGTPHSGTLVDSPLIGLYVSLGEKLSGLVRGGFSKSSTSAKQLMRMDGSPSFLDRLTQVKMPANSVKFHSISGGKNYLTIGGNPLYERVLNLVIQRQLNDANNDGLVCESSSDLSRSEFANWATTCTHHNDYADYKTLNHSYLCESQILGLRILSHV